MQSCASMADTGDPRMGERLRSQRLAKGLSQAQLAERVGVEQGSISKYEGGRIQIDPSVLKRLSRELELELDYIVHGPRGSVARELAELTEELALAL
jgi:transcriptional regulator with XRE-family HTH domain